MTKISNFAVKYRWWIMLFFFGLTALMFSQMKNSKFNADLLTYIPEDMPVRVQRQNIEEMFGGTEMIMLIVQTDDVINAETLKRVKKFSRGMTRIKGIDNVMSVFETKQVRSENGAMLVDPAVRIIPRNESDVQAIKNELRENDLVFGTLVSKDFSTTVLIGMLESGLSDEFIVGEVEKMIAENPGVETVNIGGTPFVRLNTAINMKKDISTLLPLGLILMLIFLFACFRQFRGVWIPFLVVIISIFISMGVMPILGWAITSITILLPVLLIAVANDYGIHMIAKYQEDNTDKNNFTKETLAKRMVASLGKPILLSGATTIVGLLCLLGHILIPAGQIGVLAGVGIAVALLASIFFVPAISSILPKAKPIHQKLHAKGKISIIEKMLRAFGNLVSIHPKRVLIVSAIFTMICGLGLFKIVVNTDPVKDYTDGHPVVESTKILNQKLGGFFPLAIVFEGDIKDPKLLQRIDETEKKLQQLQGVGATSSIARVIRQISRSVNDEGDEYYDKIPDNYNAVSQYFELYMMSGEPDDFEKMVDFEFQHAMILVRFTKTNTPFLREAIAEIEEVVGTDAQVKYIGGIAHIFSSLDLAVVNGQLTSLSLAVLVVFMLILFVFRSVKGSLISIVPLVLSMVILFGIMGFIGIDLNMTTALLSSIMIGVGIDYTLHYIWRYKTERENGLSPIDATQLSLRTTGRGIIFNALSVIIGFSSLLFSAFMPVRFFGALVVLTIAACLLGALLIVPAICLLTKPKFLEPKVEEVKVKEEKELELSQADS